MEEGNCLHLVGWEVVSRPLDLECSDIDNLRMRNTTLWLNGFDNSIMKSIPYGTRLLLVITGPTPLRKPVRC